ncbi:acyl-CoA dehydrogenase [Rhodococcus sp. WS4]|nr:acyl-CoA dehydrogenase [Rhodococcus sp. WS4]
MTSSPSSPRPSRNALEDLFRGRLPWDLLRPFPDQDPADRAAGDEVLGRFDDLLRAWIDPAEVDRSGQLPDGFLEALTAGGFLALTICPQLGGWGLSLFNAFRVVERAASRCMPVAFTVAVSNGFGSGSYLAALPDGPLKDMIAQRVAAGIVSAGADAEAAGTANARRTTTAVPTADGSAYVLNGEKLFIGNGPVADLLDVSATVVADDGSESVQLFFVDTRSPGFSVAARHEFMGLRGATIGALRLDDVRVPAEHLLAESDAGWRMRPGERTTSDDAPTGDAALDLGELATLGRALVILPSALAVARNCLEWSIDFVGRRSIDGRSLDDYTAIQDALASTAADVFTIESIAAWGLLGRTRADTQPDLTAAKNLTSLACWRAVDRTMSLLGAEGYETAHSKARRGARPLPVERAFRDARALRVAGGVDFMLDKWTAESALASCYYAESGAGTEYLESTGGPRIDDEWLSPRCRDHLVFVAENARSLAEACTRSTRTRRRDELFEDQCTITALGRIGSELLGMSIVLARAAGLAESGHDQALSLADISCAAAHRRVRDAWASLADEPPCADTSRALLHHGTLDFLLGDNPTDSSPRKAATAHA